MLTLRVISLDIPELIWDNSGMPVPQVASAEIVPVEPETLPEVVPEAVAVEVLELDIV